jgi:hypothetical protein
MAREILTAQGPVQAESPVGFFKALDTPEVAARSVSQLFLGVRLTCAQCHHHPFEKYGQDDYYGFSAFFARIRTKGSQEFGLFGGERVIVAASSGEVSQPRTGKKMDPKPLYGAEIPDSELDARDKRHPVAAQLRLAHQKGDVLGLDHFVRVERSVGAPADPADPVAPQRATPTATATASPAIT